jgi:hypothetical protein
MRARDLAILGAVTLVGGFAVADAIRNESSGPELATGTGRSQRATTSVVSEPDEELGRSRQAPIPGAPGTLVLTEAGDCPVREFNVATGDELPNAVPRSSCELWSAPVTAKVAVGIGAPRRGAVPFRFVDLAHPWRNLGGSRARFRIVIWSPDGQRAAWCGQSVAFDLELGDGVRRLPECPAAYTQDGEIAYAVGDTVVAGGRVLLRASGRITLVRFGTDGSIAVVVDGRRVERYERGRLRGAAELPGRLEGRIPAFSPDTCTAAVRDGDRIRFFDLGCAPLQPDPLPGISAAWSPDGRWLAVARAAGIEFYDLSEPRLVETWPITAAQIAWRR